MIGLAPSDDYADHSAPTHPGPYDALISGLPPDIPVLCRILQGLLIQEAWIERNGLNPAVFAGQSRATLSVAQRLEQLLAIDPRPLTTARPGESRALSTCRDFSLMLCGVLRHHGVPARIRCGFGRYFAPHPLHDHWVCEYWDRGEQRWVLVDAQLDQLHRDLLKFDFEPVDVLARRTSQASRRGSCAEPALSILHSLVMEPRPACSSPASTWRAICWPLPRLRPRHGTRGARRANHIVHWITQLYCYVTAWRGVVSRALSRLRRRWALHLGNN